MLPDVDTDREYWTPTPEQATELAVKHKWLMLDKDVAPMLMSMDDDYWKGFLRKDVKILVELDKVMYGYKEAAHWWNKTLIKVFMDNGYHQMSKYQCVIWSRRMAAKFLTVLSWLMTASLPSPGMRT